MELTPKVFRDVQFREKLRGGYHPEDVDEFLEQAAVASEAVLEQLRLANERAQRAEQAASEATGTDETLKRMLLMAQRTADQAVREAKDEAERLLADARVKAQTIVAEAEARARASYEAAVNERRATMEAADVALRQAQQESEALRSWVDLHRTHLLGIMKDAQALIENAGLVSEPPPVTPLPAVWSSQPGEAGRVALQEREASAHREGDTGEWDPRYLDEMGNRQPVPGGVQGGHIAPSENAGNGIEGAPGDQPGQAGAAYTGWRHAGPAGNRETAGEQTLAEGEAGLGPSGPGGPEAGTGLGGAPVAGQHSSGESAMAFDERALDNFFSEQDLGDDRGLGGRFRRRQP